ncbi:MAG TPA: ABC transporter ATP-binding protein [Azospirillaceae bacterium]|nr:ABC transporter ATP-binding protein [Azospirillaceae bacterium]
MTRLVVEGLEKVFGAVRALDNVSFEVGDQEFVTLLGPSGCGKSTTLFAIAGLDRPTGGRIALDQAEFFNGATGLFVPPEARNCGLVFQSYALWPHMTVRENVEFPLRIRRVKGPERRQRAEQALAIVEMEPYAERYPHELSGGQQQRVALARTLVYEPKVLLLDEPLSNLDAKLRLRARTWLKELQARLKITTVFVTHDQAEALSLSDRIIVMEAGRIMQIGTPEDIYRRPATAFVADFIGSSNLLPADILSVTDTDAVLTLPNGQPLRVPRRGLGANDQAVMVSIRPEHVRVAGSATEAGGNRLRGRIVHREYLGARYQYVIHVGDHLFRFDEVRNLSAGEVELVLDQEDCLVFPRRCA